MVDRVIGEAQLRVRPESEGFARELDSDVTKAVKKVEKDSPPINVKTDGRSTSALKSLSGELDSLTGKSPLASKALGAFGGSADEVGGKLGGVISPTQAVGAAVGVAVATVAKGVSEFTALAGEVRQFSLVTGASAEESSKFVAVLDDFGINSTTAARAFLQFGQQIEKNQAHLEELGIEVVRNADGTVNLQESVLNVADAFQKQQDPAKRATIAMDAFGRKGRDLIPVLSEGREGLAEFFEVAEGKQILSQEDLDRAREYELAMDRLSDVTSGFFREVGAEAVGTLTVFANSLAGIISAADDATKALGFENGLGGAVVELSASVLTGGITNVVQAVDDLTGSSDKAREKADALALAEEDLGEETADTAEVQKAAATAAKELASATDEMLRAQLGAINADIRLENAVRKTTEAREAAATAFADAAKAHGKDEEANRKNEAAVAALKQAMVDQAQAAVELEKQTAASEGRSLTAAEANGKLRDKLVELAGTLAPGNALRTELEGYAMKLQDLPPEKVTAIKLDLKSKEAYEDYRQAERDFSEGQATIKLNLNPSQAYEDFRAAERAFSNGSATSPAPKNRRAIGGPVEAGVPYLVGERGKAELFIPDAPGHIYPTVPSGGDVNVPISITIQGGADAGTVQALRTAIRTEVADAFGKVLERVGAGTGTRTGGQG